MFQGTRPSPEGNQSNYDKIISWNKHKSKGNKKNIYFHENYFLFQNFDPDLSDSEVPELAVK